MSATDTNQIWQAEVSKESPRWNGHVDDQTKLGILLQRRKLLEQVQRIELDGSNGQHHGSFTDGYFLQSLPLPFYFSGDTSISSVCRSQLKPFADDQSNKVVNFSCLDGNI